MSRSNPCACIHASMHARTNINEWQDNPHSRKRTPVLPRCLYGCAQELPAAQSMRGSASGTPKCPPEEWTAPSAAPSPTPPASTHMHAHMRACASKHTRMGCNNAFTDRWASSAKNGRVPMRSTSTRSRAHLPPPCHEYDCMYATRKKAHMYTRAEQLALSAGFPETLNTTTCTQHVKRRTCIHKHSCSP